MPANKLQAQFNFVTMRVFWTYLLMLNGFSSCALCQSIVFEKINPSFSPEEDKYSFLIYDSFLARSSMQINATNYLTSYRYVSKILNTKHLKSKKNITAYLQFVSPIILVPLTRAQGHKSVLSSENIGSLYTPLKSIKLSPHVSGVLDTTLQNLRNEKLPVYIRLHTAGIESDQVILKKEAELLFYNDDSFKNLWLEYWTRRIANVLMLGMSSQKWLYSSKRKINPNELQQDIVGNRIIGMVRNLYEPNAPYKRFTSIDELSEKEIEYLKKIASRSWLNLLDPLLFGIRSVKIGDSFEVYPSAFYHLTPFGDETSMNFLAKTNDGKFGITINKYSNYNRNFWGFNLNLLQAQFAETPFTIGFNANLWEQPEKLDFFTRNATPGLSVGVDMNYVIDINRYNDRISFDFGLSYKDEGYIKGAAYIKEGVFFNVGCSYYVESQNKKIKK